MKLFSPFFKLLCSLCFCFGLSLFAENSAQAQFPDPPTNIQASDGTSPTAITVSWTAPAAGPAAVSYKIYRAEVNNPCGAGAVVGTTNHPTTTFQDSGPGLNPQTIYYYSVVTVAAGNFESNCSASDFGRLQSNIPPLAPENVQASQSLFDKVLLTWGIPIGGQPITGFQVFRSIQATLLCQGSPLNNINTLVTSYNDTTATPGQVYYYSMLSVGPTGNSACISTPAQGFRLLPPPPNPPANVQASDGTFTNKIRVNWLTPASPSVITNYKLFRSTSPSSRCQSLRADNIPANSQTLDDSSEVVPGRLYYYSMSSTGPNGGSGCSNLDPGHAMITPPENVAATDGTFPDRVLVSWNPPTLGGDITGYELYRGDAPGQCQVLLQGALPASPTSYSDLNVIPGKFYYYSLKTLSPTGPSLCSPLDSGFAKLPAPPSVTATDGTFPDKVVVTWTPPPLGTPTSYTLYKDTVPSACTNVLFQNLGAGTTSIDDLLVNPGTLYYYSVVANSAAGPGICSPIDSGFAKAPVPLCSNGLDDDGDGRIDLDDPGCKGDPSRNDEKDVSGPVCDNGLDDDGDGKIDFRVDGAGDPGCTGPTDASEDDSDQALLSPAFVKFNTFLGQLNFAELINQGTTDKQVELTLYNLRGQRMITRSFIVPPKSEVDVDINSLLAFACDVLKSNCEGFEDLSKTRGAPNGLNRADGVVDTYGLVELLFDDTDPQERLLGRVSFYRQNPDQTTFSFAFAREFKNANKGAAYATANTYDPQGDGFIVPNWAEVINFENTTQSYRLNIYAQDGSLKDSRVFTLPPLGEFDFHAGHEFVTAEGKVAEGVFLVEVLPDNPNGAYFLSVSRYSSNAGPGVESATYNFAFSIDGLPGTKEKLFAPIANSLQQVSGLSATVSLTNWVEVVNVSAQTANLVITFRDPSGKELFVQPYSLKPKSQFHFNASALLEKNSSGVVEILSDQLIIAQGMSYVHGAANDLQSGFASVARSAGRAEQAGTINTFLGMQNVLELISTNGLTTDVEFAVSSFRGGTSSGVLGIEGLGTSSLQISNNQSLNFLPDTYGALLLETPTEGEFVAEVRRIRVVAGAVDYVMPTAVR